MLTAIITATVVIITSIWFYAKANQMVTRRLCKSLMRIGFFVLLALPTFSDSDNFSGTPANQQAKARVAAVLILIVTVGLTWLITKSIDSRRPKCRDCGAPAATNCSDCKTAICQRHAHWTTLPGGHDITTVCASCKAKNEQ